MNCTIYGTLTKPAVMLVGTWDPLIPNYFSLIDHVNEYCRQSGYEALIVLLEPSPFHMVNQKVFPIYDCWKTRVRYINRKTWGCVATVSIGEDELGKGVEDFLQIFFDKNCKVAELWLYDGQTMGRGGVSSIQNIKNVCEQLKVFVKTIPKEYNFKRLATETKSFLETGEIKKAEEILGHPPIWARSDNIVVPIGWKCGMYQYKEVSLSQDLQIQPERKEGHIHIYQNEKGDSVFEWPDTEIDIITISEAQ